ncbi:hypothetical protein [Methylomonas sp. TEB]|uniref:hypothetical protein n=1 Tax=Methylomonas sp. TEB TaxID=3398229 RepID=UPI0039F525F2
MNEMSMFWIYFSAALMFYAGWIFIARKNGQSKIIQWGGGFLATTIIAAVLGNNAQQSVHEELIETTATTETANVSIPLTSKSEVSPVIDKAEQLARFQSYTLQEAIEISKPEMEDIQGIGVSKGSGILAYWASFGLKWQELQALPKSKYGLVMKDSVPELGKRLCVTGHVAEIQRERSIDQPIFTGGIIDNEAKVYRFAAVGSTGEIVANDRASFCGIITGQQHYPNSIGGVSHAVYLVGMFDLPENKPK